MKNSNLSDIDQLNDEFLKLKKKKYIYTENDLKVIDDYFFKLGNNSRQNYLAWCEEIKKSEPYLIAENSHHFIMNDEKRNNLITYVLSSSKLKSSLNPFYKINTTRPDWNYQNTDGEHSLFLITRKGIFPESTVDKLIKDLNIDTEIKNKKGQYFTHMFFEKNHWENLLGVRVNFEEKIDFSKMQSSRYKDDVFRIAIKILTSVEHLNKVLNEYDHHFIRIRENKKNWEPVANFLSDYLNYHKSVASKIIPEVEKHVKSINDFFLMRELDKNLTEKSNPIKKIKI